MAQGAISEAAERYAAAAFELAQESNALDAIDADLKTFADAILESADLRQAATSPLIAPEEKAKALVAVAEKLGLSPLGRNLIGVAAQVVEELRPGGPEPALLVNALVVAAALRGVAVQDGTGAGRGG